MSTPSRPAVRLQEKIRGAIQDLEGLLEPSEVSSGTVAADLLRRVQETSEIDGYAPSSGGEPSRSKGTSDPTFGAIVAREADVCVRCEGRGWTVVVLPGRDAKGRPKEPEQRPCRRCGGKGTRWADPVRDALEEMFTDLDQVVRLCRGITRVQTKVTGMRARDGERKSSLQGSCMACDTPVTGIGSNRLKRGLCNACYLAWGSWKLRQQPTNDPGGDMQRYVSWRRGEMARKEREAEAEKAQRASSSVEAIVGDMDRLQKRGIMPVRRS